MRHALDLRQRLRDRAADDPRAPVQEREEDQVEAREPGQHDPADHGEVVGQGARLPGHRLLRNEAHQRPAHGRDGLPGHQVRFRPVEAADAARLRLQQVADRREIGATEDVERLRLEGVGADRVDIVVRGQFLQCEQLLALRRQCQQRAGLADQQHEALPRNLLVQDAGDDPVDGDVRADHGLEEIAAIHRRDRRNQPALARRIDVGVGPDDGARRIAARIRVVIEVELRNDHVRVVLRRGVEPRPDPVHRVVRVEVGLHDQRIGERDVAQQRIDGGEALELVVLRRPLDRRRRIEHGRAAVVAIGGQRAARLQPQPRALAGPRRRRHERDLGLAPQQLGERRHLAELLFDDLGLVFRDPRQLRAGDLAQCRHVLARGPGMAREVDGDQQQFDDQQRNQRIPDIGAPHPEQQRRLAPLGGDFGRRTAGTVAHVD